MRESTFYHCFRAFISAVSTVLGAAIGIFVAMLIIIILLSMAQGGSEIPHTFTMNILPNASGVRKTLAKQAPVILKLNISGVIGLDSLNRKAIQQLLVESREYSLKNDRVKAILLYIDSPGGTVYDADGIYREIKAYKEKYKIPVYAYVDGLCASGGMYVASAADKIFASDVSLIGSVGVVSPAFLNLTQLMDKIGIQALTLSAGKGKDDLNPLRSWKPGEDENMKAVIEYYYEKFVDIVASNRPNLQKNKLVQDYGALVYPAPLAKSYGFIDEAGSNIQDTLKQLAEKIGIHDEYYQFIELENKSWLSNVFAKDNRLMRGEIKHTLELPTDMKPALMGHFLYLYQNSQK